MEQEKQIVYFSDLFFAVLKRWKVMVVLALVFALALGGLQLLGDSKKDGPADSTAASISYNEQQVKIITENILSQQKYMTGSVLMTMDPYSSGKVTVDVYVYTDYQILPGMEYQNVDKTQAVMRSYITELQSQAALEAFCSASKIDAAYITELITTEIVANSNLLSITVRCPDAETAQKLADAVVQQLEQAKDTVATRITNHALSIVSTPSAEPVDSDVAKAQSDAAVRLTNLQNSLKIAKTELQTLKNYASDNSSAGPVIMAALGAFAGIFLVAAWAIVAHLGSNKIYSGRVLENRTGIRVLGALPEKKHTVLDHAEGRTAKPLYDVLAMNICNYCGEEKQLLLLGNISDTHKDALSKELSALGITATFEGSLLTCAGALKQLRTHNTAALIYTCGKSLYTEAEKEIAMLNDQQKTLLGGVLIDG